MSINKETFIEDFVETEIGIEKSIDILASRISDDEVKASGRENSRLVNKSERMIKFLNKDRVFAEETLDKLIEICDKKNTNAMVVASTAGALWQFNYRMEDCHRLYQKALCRFGRKSLAKKHIEVGYEGICSGRIQRPEKIGDKPIINPNWRETCDPKYLD